MSTKRQKRVGELIQEIISDLLETKLEDPRLRAVTITDAEITPDLRQARIWYSVLGESEQVEAATQALRKAAGFLRRELGVHLRLRRVPEIVFKRDDSWQRGARVDDLLQQIALESKEHDRTPPTSASEP